MSEFDEPTQQVTVSETDKNGGLIVWALCLTGLIIPLGSILAPLIYWIMKKNESQYINMHGKAVLNFQLGLLVYSILCIVLMIVPLVNILAMIFFLVLFVVYLFGTIKGCIYAKDGKAYRAPLSINFIK